MITGIATKVCSDKNLKSSSDIKIGPFKDSVKATWIYCRGYLEIHQKYWLKLNAKLATIDYQKLVSKVMLSYDFTIPPPEFYFSRVHYGDSALVSKITSCEFSPMFI